MNLQLVPETALDTGDTDLIMTDEEWADLDQHLKRRIAGAANSDAVSGRSTELEMRSYVVRQRTLGEYAEE